jgi:hypothetical protein
MRCSPRRPHPRAGAALLAVLALATAAPGGTPPPPVPAYAQGIVAGADGRPVVVPVDADVHLVPGTGVLAEGSDPLPRALVADPAAIAAAHDWLAAGAIPGAGTRWEDMSRRALLDLDLLVLDSGAAAAGWNPNWRYVWPRDAAYVAVAFTLTGREDAALAVLQHVQTLQEDDGTWQARYLPDGSGEVPDDRGPQADGLGWMLWATWVWAEHADLATAAAGLETLRPMVEAATAAVVDGTVPGLGLPHASADYWELPEREVTLGTAAPVLIGARAGVELLSALGEHDRARHLAAVAWFGADSLAQHFGRRGYPRVPSAPGRDAAVAFRMPPFAPPDPGVAAAWRQALVDLAQPNGGLTPGEDWKDDLLAWTPETALFALAAAASGDAPTAHRLLDWLDAHRSPLGSLPEKVNRNGQPAAVAPLAWTAATVLITLSVLDGEGPATPPVPAPPTGG